MQTTYFREEEKEPNIIKKESTSTAQVASTYSSTQMTHLLPEVATYKYKLGSGLTMSGTLLELV